MIKAIIIDDEIRARTLLQKMLAEYCPEVEVVSECEDLPNGVKSIRKLKPDLVFLDIEMPGHSGLELLEFFDEDDTDFAIIFITAYNQYAIQAFKLSAVDYLLKPVAPNDLENAIERYKRRGAKDKTSLNQLRETLKQTNVQKIAVPEGNSIKFIELDTIMYFKADSSYTEIFFTDNTKLIISRTLKNIEEALHDNPNFLRSHKSYLVNMKYVTDYVKSDGGYIIMRDKYELPITQERVDELLEHAPFVRRK